MSKATVKETQFAVYFLKKLGVGTGNAYLITAVIAWLRQESGGLSKVIGNNPFNIRQSKYASGYRQTKGNGKFAIFSSLKMGAIASAQLLLDAGHDYRGYWRIVKAARRANDGTDGDKQKQALDFLAAIALSKWDAAHYGTGRDVTLGTYDPAKNHLVRVWATISGIPAIPVEPTAKEKDTRKRAAKPRPPGPLNPPTSNHSYLDPWEPRGFYRDVHRQSDMGNLPRA